MKIIFRVFDLHTTLRPCPFCGGTKLEVCDDGDRHDSGYVDLYVYCDICGVYGPRTNGYRHNKEYHIAAYNARKEWNTRHET